MISQNTKNKIKEMLQEFFFYSGGYKHLSGGFVKITQLTLKKATTPKGGYLA